MNFEKLDVNMVCSEIATLKILGIKLKQLGKTELANEILTDSSPTSLFAKLKKCESLENMDKCEPLLDFIKEHDLPIECNIISITNDEIRDIALKQERVKLPIAIRVLNFHDQLHTVNIIGYYPDDNTFIYDDEIINKTKTNFASPNLKIIPEKRKYISRERKFRDTSLETWRFYNKNKDFGMPENYAFHCVIKKKLN